MAKIEYDGYSIDAVPPYIMRYVEGSKRVDFWFDPGGPANNSVGVYNKPTECSKNVDAKDVARALDRVVAHLTSVGYTVFIINR